MAHLSRRLQKRIVVHRFCKFGRSALSRISLETITSPQEKTGSAVRVMLSICQFICSHLASFQLKDANMRRTVLP